MKKILLVLILLLGFSMLASAQVFMEEHFDQWTSFEALDGWVPVSYEMRFHTRDSWGNPITQYYILIRRVYSESFYGTQTGYKRVYVNGSYRWEWGTWSQWWYRHTPYGEIRRHYTRWVSGWW
jgi:hypothetical protein